MSARDPETGQFVESAGQADQEYLNWETVYYNTQWGPDLNNGDTNADGFVDFGGGNIRGAYVEVDIDRPDDHLVELLGWTIFTGDPNDCTTRKADIHLWEGHTGEPPDAWADIMAQEHPIDSHSIHLESCSGGPSTSHPGEFQTTFPVPVLTAGKLQVYHVGGGNNTQGEIGVTLWYNFVKAERDEIINELLRQS